jgi:DNA uptake protein ComE-like DNA-binding protein
MVGGVAGGAGVAGGGAGGKTQEWKAANFESLKIDTSQGAQGKVRQVLDLIGAQFTANVNNEQVTFTSPLNPSPIAMATYLPTIMDKLTAVEATVLPGRININEAPREVLAGLPGISEEVLEKLIESRSQDVDNSNRKLETWPMVEGIITLQEMQTIAPLITAGGDAMRVQSVGYFEQSAGFARIEAVIDASGSVPIVVLYRKMDHLGRGFSQTTLGQRAQGLTVSQ